ncbi:MAG: glycosyltransferase family 2 protein [Methanobrevibacter sp.]|nr:glycosyltransferase family 2 protein [Methanobrevibacter sp.]
MGKNIVSLLTQSHFDFKTSALCFKFYDEIKRSGLYDEDFYLKTYDDVSGDGLTHYLVKGFREGKSPSLDFDDEFYLKAYPDVKQAGINPLLHYIAYGVNEDKIIQNSYSIRRKDEICESNLPFLTNYHFEEEPLVSIIILNRDGINHLKRLFKDFDKKTNYSNYEIIVVDNASSDESVEYLKSLNLPITVIENDINVSFSKGNNYAAGIAKGDYLLLLNNDIEPTYGWLNELMGTIVNNENVACVGAKLVFPYYFTANRNKSFQIQHSGDIFAERMYPCCLYAVNKSNSNLDIFDSALTQNNYCIAVTGAVMLVDKKVYEDVGGLCEDYNYGLEDVDFCLKLYENNFDVMFAANALLFHHESSTRVKSKSYFENDKNNYSIFWDKWGQFLSRNLLLDKIHDKGFFTDKKLKITIIDDNFTQNQKIISEISKKFNELNYTVELITNMKNHYIGNSADILLSFTDKYDVNELISRSDIIKVLVIDKDTSDSSDFDISLSFDKSIKSDIYIENDFVSEFLDKLEKILTDGYEF